MFLVVTERKVGFGYENQGSVCQKFRNFMSYFRVRLFFLYLENRKDLIPETSQWFCFCYLETVFKDRLFK